jgi:hypothetical protein
MKSKASAEWKRGTNSTAQTRKVPMLAVNPVPTEIRRSRGSRASCPNSHTLVATIGVSPRP